MNIFKRRLEKIENSGSGILNLSYFNDEDLEFLIKVEQDEAIEKKQEIYQKLRDQYTKRAFLRAFPEAV